MGARAVFSQGTLGVYLTGPDLIDLLTVGLTEAAVYIGKHKIGDDGVTVSLDEKAQKVFRQAYDHEIQARLAVRQYQQLALDDLLSKSQERQAQDG